MGGGYGVRKRLVWHMAGFISRGRPNYFCILWPVDLVDLFGEAFIFSVVVTMC